MYAEKSKLKRNKFFKIVFKLAIIAYFIFISIKFGSAIMLNFKKEDELKTLQNNLNHTLEENKKIQNQINSGITDDYAFERARNELNLVDPLEIVFFDVSV